MAPARRTAAAGWAVVPWPPSLTSGTTTPSAYKDSSRHMHVYNRRRRRVASVRTLRPMASAASVLLPVAGCSLALFALSPAVCRPRRPQQTNKKYLPPPKKTHRAENVTTLWVLQLPHRFLHPRKSSTNKKEGAFQKNPGLGGWAANGNVAQQQSGGRVQKDGPGATDSLTATTASDKRQHRVSREVHGEPPLVINDTHTL